MRKMSWIAAIVLVGASVVVSAQKADPDAQKLADQYTAAFNKGDAKALTALYAADGTRLGPDGAVDRGTGGDRKELCGWVRGPAEGCDADASSRARRMRSRRT